MTRSRRLRLPVAVAAATGVALAIAGPASAHIHTDPASVQAGKKATVGFIVEHGCGNSPTTKVEIQMPKGATGISGVDEAGFTSSVSGQVVTFSGGTLPDGTEQAFKVTFTAPKETGDVPVKLIQTCEQGSLEWIELQPAGQPEPEHPAPILAITEGAGGGTSEHDHGTETTVAEHDHGTETTVAEHGHDEETTTTEAEHGHDAETTTTVAVGATGSDDDGDDSSSAPLVAGVVAALAVIGGGTALYLRNRKGADAPAGGSDAAGGDAAESPATPDPEA